jgi:hypothetical protein
MPRASANNHHAPPAAPPEPSPHHDLTFVDTLGPLLARASGIIQASRRLCRKFSCGDDVKRVDPVGGLIRRPGRRTVGLP